MTTPCFLLTFANQLASPPLSALFAHFHDRKFLWLPICQDDLKLKETITGAAGACLLPGKRLALCTQGAPPSLLLFTLPSAEKTSCLGLQRVVDPHSMLFAEDYLYIVSTGTNSIYRLHLEGPTLHGEELFWQYPGLPQDKNVVHLNGITRYRDTFITSCFGEKPSNKGKNRNGKIFFLDTGATIAEGLNQPHSPFFFQNKLLVAESGSGKVLFFEETGSRTFELQREVETGGYPRGLAVNDGKLYIGISSTRNISKSQKRMLAPQVTTNITSVMELDFEKDDPLVVFDLQPFAREIYDVLAIEAGPDLLPQQEGMQERILAMEARTEYFFETRAAALEAIEELQKNIQVLQSSYSWKITAPLRWLDKKLNPSTSNNN